MNEIKSVISQLERQRAAIERALEALREIEVAVSGPQKRGTASQKKRGRKRRMSAEGRARIGEATRKRWAEKRAATKKSGRVSKKGSGTKRSISPEGRERIAEAARRMWAEKKATKKVAQRKSVAAE